MAIMTTSRNNEVYGISSLCLIIDRLSDFFSTYGRQNEELTD